MGNRKRTDPALPANEKTENGHGGPALRIDAAARGSQTGKAADADRDEQTGTVLEGINFNGSQSGEDVRQRGWFWHWNELHTEYGPLLQHSGIGLITSYIVWTDRREHSPYRGYAFPSLQTQAAFSGSDRAELITINRILVALDLIEIRKEMINHTNDRGHKLKTPHNLYRVKDRSGDPHLTKRDVVRVLELAAARNDVYRHIRHVLSPGFQPISRTNIWHRLLEELAGDPLWIDLSAKAAEEEARYSARTRAGHRSRQAKSEDGAAEITPPDKKKPTIAVLDPAIWVPGESDVEGGDPVATGFASDRERTSPSPTPMHLESADSISNVTSVAASNHGLESTVAGSDEALGDIDPGIVAPSKQARKTSVAPANAMYDQFHTTTTTSDGPEKKNDAPVTGAAVDVTEAVTKDGAGLSQVGSGPGEQAPGSGFGPDQAAAMRTFAEANGREHSGAEERLLNGIAAEIGSNGWLWIRGAIDEAVDSGSGFVAPKRVREIVRRWMAEGLPAEVAGLGTGNGERRNQDGGWRTENPEPGIHRESRRENVGEGLAPSRPEAQPLAVGGEDGLDQGGGWSGSSQEGTRPSPTTREESAAGSGSAGNERANAVGPYKISTGPFRVEEAGLGSGQVWSAVIDVLESEGMMRASDVRDYLVPAKLVARLDARTFAIEVGDALSRSRIAQFWTVDIEEALGMVLGGRGWRVEIVDASPEFRVSGA